MVTARLPLQPRNASREALFLADASAFAAARVASDPQLQRLDILQLRPADAATTDATYSFLGVLARGSDADALPEYLTASLRVESTVRLRTLFPERTRWRQMKWQPQEGELPELGSLALLVEQTTFTMQDEAAAGVEVVGVVDPNDQRALGGRQREDSAREAVCSHLGRLGAVAEGDGDQPEAS